jgi:hypothetical protein
MAWRGRLRDLILAGGAFAATSGCSGTPLSSAKDAAQDFVFVGGVGCGNANPDPCICERPEASAAAAMDCEAEIACQAQGRVWQPFYMSQPDGAVVPPHCLPADGAIDGPGTVGNDGASRDGALDR